MPKLNNRSEREGPAQQNTRQLCVKEINDDRRRTSKRDRRQGADNNLRLPVLEQPQEQEQDTEAIGRDDTHCGTTDGPVKQREGEETKVTACPATEISTT